MCDLEVRTESNESCTCTPTAINKEVHMYVSRALLTFKTTDGMEIFFF